ncbi:hypothetical protein ACVWZM_004746 [Bradyrhizobium sp. USDA 4501]
MDPVRAIQRLRTFNAASETDDDIDGAKAALEEIKGIADLADTLISVRLGRALPVIRLIHHDPDDKDAQVTDIKFSLEYGPHHHRWWAYVTISDFDVVQQGTELRRIGEFSEGLRQGFVGLSTGLMKKPPGTA